MQSRQKNGNYLKQNSFTTSESKTYKSLSKLVWADLHKIYEASAQINYALLKFLATKAFWPATATSEKIFMPRPVSPRSAFHAIVRLPGSLGNSMLGQEVHLCGHRCLHQVRQLPGAQPFSQGVVFWGISRIMWRKYWGGGWGERDGLDAFKMREWREMERHLKFL